MGAKWENTRQEQHHRVESQKQNKTEKGESVQAGEAGGAMLVRGAEEESTSITIHSQEKMSEASLMAQHGRKMNKQRPTTTGG